MRSRTRHLPCSRPQLRMCGISTRATYSPGSFGRSAAASNQASHKTSTPRLFTTCSDRSSPRLRVCTVNSTSIVTEESVRKISVARPVASRARTASRVTHPRVSGIARCWPGKAIAPKDTGRSRGLSRRWRRSLPRSARATGRTTVRSRRGCDSQTPPCDLHAARLSYGRGTSAGMRIADGEDLVDDQDLGLQVRRHGEGQADVHAR